MPARLADRLALAATAVIFCAALAVLYREFAGVSAREVLARLAIMTEGQVLAAAALTAASYLLLTGYDFLALRYVGRRLRLRDVLLASFTAFAFSNNLGFQLLSGGSMRYRVYSSLGLDAVAIGEIVAFCTVAYALGVVTVGGLLALLNPLEVAAMLNLPQVAIEAGGLALLGVTAAYLMAAALWRSPIELGRYRLRPPRLSLALAQVALASVDAVLAGTVLYVLLPADLGLSYQSYLTVYVLGATVSVLSLVPGGLGVFETAITVLTAPPSKAAALGAFFAYRIIYFILPLAVALLLFARHEVRRKSAKRPAAVPR